MKDIGSLSHTRWECKYHVVFIPKYRRKAIYYELRQHLGKIFHHLARQKECRIEEGHLMVDHVHMLLSIPPKYSVSQVVGFIKGKSAIAIARTYLGKRQDFTGQHFWARGYYVSTVGRDEAIVRQYIRDQEKEDQRLEQLKLWSEG
ncbi:IS200/IS605 family transposase [Leptolyngbya sp. FACHB-541]|uniref:IS200/IS605 family transposase n=1 Tax=Leptolyngbya sp. FACHB-541 TaxID=2692810 RepID=UPI001686A4B8|nr:IS200/IS605 family transposase [Leptolyngbya sp. FACHB-541]MBD1997240.1 IS200/IS605 family transposase [Leptolyngbya sp. FACHB-541]